MSSPQLDAPPRSPRAVIRDLITIREAQLSRPIQDAATRNRIATDLAFLPGELRRIEQND